MAIVNRAWMMGDTSVDRHGNPVEPPAPAAEPEAPAEAAPVERKRRSKLAERTMDDDFPAWTLCGGTVVLAAAGALGADMGSSGFIEKLLFAAALIGGALIATAIIVLAGCLIYRILLGVDGIDVEKPHKWRLILCIALFVVLLALMM